MPCFSFVVASSSLPLNCSSLTISPRDGCIGMHKALEGLSACTTKTHTARNRSKKKFFVRVCIGRFLSKRSVVQGQRGAYLL